MSNLVAAKGTKAPRRLPDGAKEVLQEFVIDVLRQAKKVEKDRFITFAADWFKTRSEMEKDKPKDPVRDFPITPSNIGGGSWNAPAPEPSTMPLVVTESQKEVPPPPQPIPEMTIETTPSTASNIDGEQGRQWIGSAPSEYNQQADTLNLQLAQPDVQLTSSSQTLDAPSAVSLAPLESGSTVNIPESAAQPESQMELGNHTASPLTGTSGGGAQFRRWGVSAESYDPSAPVEESAAKSFPKSVEQLARVKDAVKEVLLFRSLDDDQLSKVIDALEEFPVEKGIDLIKFGDETAEHFYVIDNGEYDCFAPVNGIMVKVHSYSGQGSFGELALMYNQPRAATITAKTPGKLWRLDRETFRRIVLRSAFQKRELYKKLMDQVDFLADLQPYEKENICDALEAKIFNSGDVIMKQGETGDGMYFIEAGEVVCKRAEHNEKEKEIARVGPGQYVGELALIAGQPRAATVTATSDGTKLAFLDAKAFERLMGPCVDILKKNVDRYREKIIAVFGENSDFLALK